MIFKHFGGIETLAELCEKKGEDQAVMIISMLGYSLNSGESKEGKSSSSTTITYDYIENAFKMNNISGTVDYFSTW